MTAAPNHDSDSDSATPVRTDLPAPTPTPEPTTATKPVLTKSREDAAEVTARALERLPMRLAKIREHVADVVVGQEHMVDTMVQALLSRGHCLLVGVPGLAKTLLVKTMARLMKLHFSRIQFTPDLMPSDITGTVILHTNAEDGHRGFKFSPGPIFSNVILADEINRTPPKTQAALLEAMQEKTVTVANKTHALEEPFIVLATQNPIEQEGTYPLPEAQLDRFLFQLEFVYPTLEDERRLVAQHSFTPLESLTPIFTREEILAYRDAVARIPAAPNVIDYAVRLVRATRPDDATAPDYIRRYIRWGASPRASQNLILAGRAVAACQGRFHVSCEDVAQCAPSILGHRLVRSFQADADGASASQIVTKLLNDIPRLLKTIG